MLTLGGAGLEEIWTEICTEKWDFRVGDCYRRGSEGEQESKGQEEKREVLEHRCVRQEDWGRRKVEEDDIFQENRPIEEPEENVSHWDGRESKRLRGEMGSGVCWVVDSNDLLFYEKEGSFVHQGVVFVFGNHLSLLVRNTTVYPVISPGPTRVTTISRPPPLSYPLQVLKSRLEYSSS